MTQYIYIYTRTRTYVLHVFVFWDRTQYITCNTVVQIDRAFNIFHLIISHNSKPNKAKVIYNYKPVWCAATAQLLPKPISAQLLPRPILKEYFFNWVLVQWSKLYTHNCEHNGSSPRNVCSDLFSFLIIKWRQYTLFQNVSGVDISRILERVKI